MDGSDNVTRNAAATTADAAAKTRQRSTIAFPYTDLASSIDLANAIHSHVGLGDCDDDQLAAWVGQSPKSSSFRTQMYAARTFGILEGEGSSHRLTELGRLIADPDRRREGRARAFLTVPLYKAIYEKYRGGILPPAAALERDIVAFGVAEKQKDRARQVFERSADQSGFFGHGRNRLVQPGIVPGRTPPGGGGGSGDGGDGNGGHKSLDPIIKGLIDRLPDPGSVWPESQRKLWLQILENSFRLVYRDETAGANKPELRMENEMENWRSENG